MRRTPRELADTGVFSALITAAVVVPLVWWPGADDAFAQPKITALRVLMALALLLGAVRWTGGKLRRRSIGAFEVALLAWVLLNALSFAASRDHHQSWYGEELQSTGALALLLAVSGLMLARSVFLSTFRIKALLWAVASAGALVAAHALVQQAGLDPFWSAVEFGRPPAGQIPVFASIGHSSALAAFMVTGMAAAVFLIPLVGRVQRVVLMAGLGTMGAALVLTLNRGGFMAFAGVLAVATAALIPLIGRIGRRRLMWFALSSAVVISAVALVGPVRSVAANAWDRTVSITESGASSQIRWELWRAGVVMASSRPLLGTGQETFADEFNDHRTEALSAEAATWFATRRAESAHNLFVNMSVEIGIPALVGFAFLMLSAARRMIIALRRIADPLVRAGIFTALAVMTGHLISSMFMNPDVTTTWTFWLFVGAGVGMADGYGPCEETLADE